MKKFFEKGIAEECGYGFALELAALGATLLAEIETIDALRKAEGRRSLGDEDARDRAEFAALMDEFGEDGYDPDMVAWVRGG